MSTPDRQQRIKLRCEGSPVKFDGTVIESTPDGKRIRIKFDGPLEDAVLYAYGDHKMVSDMRDTKGNPTTEVREMSKCLWWDVL